jgi:hypothetical protein
MRKNSLPVAVSMLVVFLSGSVVGALGHRLYTVRTVVEARDQRPPSPQEYKARYISELQDRLSLDEQQTSRVDAILDGTHARFKELHERTKPERMAIHEAQVREIRSILKPDQMAGFEEFLKERERRRKEMQRQNEKK